MKGWGELRAGGREVAMSLVLLDPQSHTVVTSHLCLFQPKQRCVVSAKYTLDFKDLLPSTPRKEEIKNVKYLINILELSG